MPANISIHQAAGEQLSMTCTCGNSGQQGADGSYKRFSYYKQQQSGRGDFVAHCLECGNTQHNPPVIDVQT